MTEPNLDARGPSAIGGRRAFPEAQWVQALDEGGLFREKFGNKAAELGCTRGPLALVTPLSGARRSPGRRWVYGVALQVRSVEDEIVRLAGPSSRSESDT
jgi:hypothetical protein